MEQNIENLKKLFLEELKKFVETRGTPKYSEAFQNLRWGMPPDVKIELTDKVYLTTEYHGTHPLNSNIMQHVFRVNGTELLIDWPSGYTSWDNGGPDGDLDHWQLESPYFVTKQSKVVEFYS